MTDTEARKLLRGDKSYVVFRLRSCSQAEHEQVLRLESARPRPRKLLSHLLKRQIEHLQQHAHEPGNIPQPP